MVVACFPRLLLAASLSMLLSACGGGGGGGGSDTAASPSGSANTAETASDERAINVSGYAVKGVISNGIITAWGVEDDGSLVRLGESVRTGKTGFYDLDLSTSAELIKLELSSDGNTRMRCDAVDGCQDYGGSATAAFGEDFWPGPNLQLETMVSVGVDQEQPGGHLTPLTTLSTSLFESTGANTGWQGFLQAQRKVEGWFGLQQGAVGLTPVDITSVLPADIDQAELEAALVNSAFLGLAVEFPVEGVQGVIDAFRSQLLTTGVISDDGPEGQPGSDRIQQYAAFHAYTLAQDETSSATAVLASAGDRLSSGVDIADDSGSQPDSDPVAGTDGGAATDDSDQAPAPEQDVVESPAPQPEGNVEPAPEQDPATTAMTATLTWQAPQTRADGTGLAMGEIGQYIVRYGTQPDVEAMTSEVIVEDGQAMETEVTGLAEGTWYFAMRTVDQNGLESAWSEVASKTITR
ncbi:hypothetical protein [Marinobacter sp.]|uniref:hypothetical protein n=1 Tax=Marinobacter sp. TaxID=50741 RepID=UPI003564835A